jgi:hypothetical protein
MPTGRISMKSVDAFLVRRERIVRLWDDAISGFGVAAFPSGKKVYVAQYRIDDRSRRVSIGRDAQ